MVFGKTYKIQKYTFRWSARKKSFKKSILSFPENSLQIRFSVSSWYFRKKCLKIRFMRIRRFVGKIKKKIITFSCPETQFKIHFWGSSEQNILKFWRNPQFCLWWSLGENIKNPRTHNLMVHQEKIKKKIYFSISSGYFRKNWLKTPFMGIRRLLGKNKKIHSWNPV